MEMGGGAIVPLWKWGGGAIVPENHMCFPFITLFRILALSPHRALEPSHKATQNAEFYFREGPYSNEKMFEHI